MLTYMIFIVTTSEDKNRIMTAIMEDAGIDTKAGSLVFSLPVTATAGFKLTKDLALRKKKASAQDENDDDTEE